MQLFEDISRILSAPPAAWARLTGSEKYPDLIGAVNFYPTDAGVIVAARFAGLPKAEDCLSPIFALHIHEGGACQGNELDPFSDVGSHYNPRGCQHPYHAGDLPSVFGSGGVALSICLSDRFTVEEVIGKAVILHGGKDDFTTQPAGNAGQKIACGIITA